MKKIVLICTKTKERKVMKKLLKKAISSILAFAIAITAVAQLPLSEGIGLTGTAVMAAAETTIPDGYTPVYTMEDLYNIRSNTSGKYIIMNDIDMSGTAEGGEWDGGKGWTPIPEFSGTIDGAGHRLMNMNIFGSVGDYSGFIGKLSPGGTVKNIRFTNVDVNTTGGTSYGTVAGYSNGTITKCSVSGTINTKNSCTGGICGIWGGISSSIHPGTYINICYNNSAITNSNSSGCIGGIVGSTNYCTPLPYISDCYNTGVVNASSSSCGGIAGNGYYAKFTDCVNYSDGRITYKANSVTTSYYLTGATFGSSSYGTVLTESLMQQQASYTGLDFDNTWYMCPEHNRPELKSLQEIYDKNITGVSFASLPDTLIYKQGDKISIDGAMLSVSADDGTTTKVSLFKNMLSGYDMSVVGKQTVTVTVGDCTATYQITVLPIEVSDITLSAKELTINKGKTSTLTATVSPDNATDKTVTWTSSDETVATVDAEGKVTAVKVGTATIKATAGTKSAECVVTVKSPASEITLSDSSVTIHSGDTKQLTATLSPEDCTDSVRWTSSNEEAATVDENGLVTAVKPGTAIITAAAQSGVMDICTVTVDAPAKSITFEEAEKIINIGDNVKLNVTVDPDFTTDTLTWSVDDSNICTVDKDGTITGYSKGTATVTVKATSGVSATCKVIVNSPALSITLNKTSAKLEYGSTENLTYELFPLDSNDTVEWTTSDSSICLVNSNGMIRAVAPGTATITATTGSGKTATCIVTVVVSATSLTLDKSEVTMYTSDSSLTVNYTLSPSVTTDKITWTSSNTSVATVTDYASSSYIKITPKSYGTAVITGKTDSGITATCNVTVKKYASSISLKDSEASINKGETYQIELVPYPDYAVAEFIRCSSSNTSVATVDSKGLITAVGAGTTKITVYTRTYEYLYFYITVKVPSTQITLDKSTAEVNIGKTLTLTATLSPDDSTDTVTWTSSDTSIATVSSTGVVTGKSKGTATITATAESGITATCEVTVKVPATSVKMSKTSATLYVGETVELSATMTPAETTDTINWKSSNTSVATVSENGVVTAKANGDAIITATTTSGKTATCKVTVIKPATAIKLSKTSLSLNKGKTYTLKATMSPTTTTDKVTWKSSNTAIAKVSATGVVTAVAKGTATITATTGSGKTATCKVTVLLPSTSVTLSKTSLSLNKGKTYTLKATMSPSTTTDKVTWKSSNTKVATVSSTGVVKAIAKGTCTITATTTSGKKATCKVTVLIPSTSVKLSKTSATVIKGKTLTLKATMSPTTTTDKVTWKSSNTKVATVSSTGVVKAIAKGTCTITATTTSGKKATCKITVKEIKATGIKLSKTSATVAKGKTLTLKATLTPSNTTDKVTWKSSNTKVATVSSTGVVKGIKYGTCTITATINGKKATCKITVPKGKTTKITLNKTSANINVGKTVSLTATINPTNSDEACKWSVSDPSIATITTNGKTCTVKGKKAGTVTITAKSGTKSVTCKVTVKSGPETPSIDIEFVGESGMSYVIGIIFTNNKSKDIKILAEGARLYSSSSFTSGRDLNMIDYDYYDTYGDIRYISSLTLYGGPGYAGMIFSVKDLYETYVSRSSVLKLYFMYDGVKYYCLAGPDYGVKVYKA